jgi:spermidine synthase
MFVSEVIDNTQTVDGDDLVLSCIGQDWAVHTGPTLLMSSKAHHSEDALARLAIARVDAPKQVLVGGLGMGFTLRATLDCLPPEGHVVLAETSEDVVRWNRTHIAHLAGNPLQDPRVHLRLGDVGECIAEAPDNYDVILLDVDNGPYALVHSFNSALYGSAGSRAAWRALRPGGILAVWSRRPVPSYAARLRRVGFRTKMVDIPSPDDDKASDTLFLARKLSS